MDKTFLAIGCIVVLMNGCGGGPSHPELARVHATCVEALRAGDMTQIYELSSASFHQEMDALAGRLNRIDAFLRKYEGRLPEAKIRGALALEDVRFPLEGSELFREITGLQDFSFGPGIEAGLSPSSTQVSGSRGVVETQGGESFLYLSEAGAGWKLTLASESFARWEGRALLLAQLEALETFMADVEKGENQDSSASNTP